MRKFILACGVAAIFTSVQSTAATYMIGDNDGFGVGVPDNADHPFTGIPPYDNRSAAEKAAMNGAQYTDTYSTTQPGYSPQAGAIATFIFTNLGSGWTQGAMTFDLADFQASTFGATVVTYNGFVQNWAFNDGYPKTAIHSFDLQQNVLNSINSLGSLTVKIDRSASTDFYGFDYAMLTDYNIVTPMPAVPEPATWAMMILGFGVVGHLLRRGKSHVRTAIRFT